jgi:hypothetical protein
MTRKNELKAAGNSRIPSRFGAQESKASSPLRSAGALQKATKRPNKLAMLWKFII